MASAVHVTTRGHPPSPPSARSHTAQKTDEILDVDLLAFETGTSEQRRAVVDADVLDEINLVEGARRVP
jgi:hypothetical protein